MQFLILRGHSRLVPQGGISEFPDAILNAKRLDLYNLYREVFLFKIILVNLKKKLTVRFFLGFQVVSRGGFHVGNGINWKGQVFSKMRNHTMTNRMTVCSYFLNGTYLFFSMVCQNLLGYSLL